MRQRCTCIIAALGIMLHAGVSCGMIVLTNLGGMALGETRQIAMPVMNTSAAAWSITAAVCSCSCVTVTDWPRALAPGSSAVVRITLHADMPGTFGYVISLVDQNHGGPAARIILNVSIDAPADKSSAARARAPNAPRHAPTNSHL